MSNLQVIEIERKSPFSVVKFIIFATISISIILTATDLSASENSRGPGPHFGGPGHMHQGGHDDGNYYDVENLAYYGDWDSNRVVIINIDDMSVLKVVTETGDGPYGVDQQNAETAYALTRKTESLTVIENYFIENIGKIFLDHKPRSTNFNPGTGYSLVSGADKVMTSLIKVNSDKVKRVFGLDELVQPHDYGGSLATGHPLWVDETRFFMLDRPARQIQLWSRRKGLLSVLDTPTSVHHVFQSPLERFDDTYYAVVEGNRGEGLSPSILRFKIRRGQMIVTGESVLSEYAPLLLNPAEMGSHHADFHPDGVHIYIGSAEGHVFVVNKNSMNIVAMIETGMGSGHTTFVPMHDRAFVTNHNDTYMTVINTIDHSWLMNIEVAGSASSDYKSQAHTSGVSPYSNYFYSAASHDGVFFEIDVENLVISRLLDVGSEMGEEVNILMGSFIWAGEGDGM